MLMMLYMVTVSGFALNLHYCFDRLSSVKIDVPANTCVKTLQVNKMKCCKDKHIEVKVKDAHQTGTFSFLAKTFSFDLPKLAYADFSTAAQRGLSEKIADRGPPLLSSNVPLFLKNCLFRI
jgi:hypothetical protein